MLQTNYEMQDMTLKIPALKATIQENIENGYEKLFNFPALLECLDRETSIVRKLFLQLKAKRKTIDNLNWLCIGVGAMNFFANRELPDDPFQKIASARQLEQLVMNNWDGMWEICLRKSNNPTVPQRAMPFACHVSRMEGRVAVFELGCSRGDIGLVWLDINHFLNGDYFFPCWGVNTRKSLFRSCRPIEKYFGIDIDIQTDDEWLLALWGIRDPRRHTLKIYYDRYKCRNNDVFFRLQADATQRECFEQQVLDWSADCDHLVVITSYMLYQLPIQRRKIVAQNIRRMGKTFKEQRKDRQVKVSWLNQGMNPEQIFVGQLQLDDIWLCELSFGNQFIESKRLAHIKDDTAQEWTVPKKCAVEKLVPISVLNDCQ